MLQGLWGVLVSIKILLVLGRFSYFDIAIAYSNSQYCGAWTPSFGEFTWNFSKTSTPQGSMGLMGQSGVWYEEFSLSVK